MHKLDPSSREARRAALAALALSALLTACGGGSSGGSAGTAGSAGAAGAGGSPGCIAPGADDQKAVQTALIEVKEGSTICFTEGTFHFDTELELDARDVTIRGAGQDKTVWDFSKQDVGANGLLIKGDSTVVEELSVKNTPGDGIRADNVMGITFRKVSVIWDADASLINGAYGLYPIGSSAVLIDACTVKGARDAGIYVGQSTDIVVKDSETYGNVAGIEIENSTDAEVMNNKAHDNTAGILVFNLPNLPVQDGKRAKVHDNIIENNNQPNFAEPGTTVAKVPNGTGLMLLATDDNEIHNNTFKGNDSVGILIVSYLSALFDDPNDPEYNKYPEGNFIHDNTFEGNGTKPSPLIQAASAGLMPIPDIVWDGCADPGAAAAHDGRLTNCLSVNKDGAGEATYADAGLCGRTGCINTQSDAAHCGACEHTCGAGTCTAGQCPDAKSCKGIWVSVQSDPANCGDCGNECAAGMVCSAGACAAQCAPGETDCTGACVDTKTSRDHCGACGVKCAGGAFCSMGGCVCPAGKTDCASVCADLQTDGGNCGACGIVCPPEHPVCDSGICVEKCSVGAAICPVSSQISTDASKVTCTYEPLPPQK
jgi:parallel beta-helix repeat protein